MVLHEVVRLPKALVDYCHIANVAALDWFWGDDDDPSDDFGVDRVQFFRIEPQDRQAVAALADAGALFAVMDAPPRGDGRGIDLDRDGTPERFRICSSNEGLHFVVERGEAVLWHAYYHLGLDVEPDCPERIYAE